MQNETKTLHERLAEVQAKLKAPKNQNNTFGGYRYRSCEDILEAVKPLLKEQGMLLVLSDELKNIGDRYYIKATAVVAMPVADGQHAQIKATAYAREEETKKGMDGSQITGTASSYARKYALNGLFLIDDTKDADTNEHHTQTASRSAASQPVSRPTTRSSSRQFEDGEEYSCEVAGCSNTQEGSWARKCHAKHGQVYCGKHWKLANTGELNNPKENIEPQGVMDAYGGE